MEHDTNQQKNNRTKWIVQSVTLLHCSIEERKHNHTYMYTIS